MLSRGVLGRLAERSAGIRILGSANQRNLDIELAQFRDVIAAGSEILHLDVLERVKHPPPVAVAVATNSRCLHNKTLRHCTHGRLSRAPHVWDIPPLRASQSRAPRGNPAKGGLVCRPEPRPAALAGTNAMGRHALPGAARGAAVPPGAATAGVDEGLPA